MRYERNLLSRFKSSVHVVETNTLAAGFITRLQYKFLSRENEVFRKNTELNKFMNPSLADPMCCVLLEEKVLLVNDWVTVKSGVCVRTIFFCGI